MTAILGISAFYHDSAAALVRNGHIVAAAQEERFTRKKHDRNFPTRAIAYCLEEAGLTAEAIDYVAYYEKPLSKLERLIETFVAFVPRGFESFRRAVPVWLKEKLNLRRTIRKALPGAAQKPLVFLDHHESHAASAFFPSPFDEAAILTLDGVGEWSTTTYGVGEGNRIRITDHLQFPHSLGLLYSAFTYYCGFKVNSGEYKLMGLAPYGKPVYRDLILKHLIDLKPDGSFWLDMKYFNYGPGLTMTSRAFDRLFGGPPRDPETDLEQRHMDLAASIQAVTEEVILRMGQDLHRRTRQKHLVLAGGVALNCVANGKLLREGPFDNIWIQPAAGDAGGALGAALFVWHQLLQKPRRVAATDAQEGSLLGPAFTDNQIEEFLAARGLPYQRYRTQEEMLAETVSLLADGKVIGWFQGRMEFGPRALGARSILGDPRSRTMQTTMNVKIKFRESFRPFAPSVLKEEAQNWFDVPAHWESPYMLLVAPVRTEHRTAIPEEERQVMEENPDLRKRVNVARSTVPAITHVDYSARVQTVDEERNPLYYRLLRTFQDKTDCPILVNTSFNVRGEPIVCTPEDAYRCFRATDMDALVMGNCIVLKKNLPTGLAVGREKHLAQFELD